MHTDARGSDVVASVSPRESASTFICEKWGCRAVSRSASADAARTPRLPGEGRSVGEGVF
jgi:hypothetical protein